MVDLRKMRSGDRDFAPGDVFWYVTSGLVEDENGIARKVWYSVRCVFTEDDRGGFNYNPFLMFKSVETANTVAEALESVCA